MSRDFFVNISRTVPGTVTFGMGPGQLLLVLVVVGTCTVHQSFKIVLRIRDVYCLSRILIFTHPGSRIPDPKQEQKRGVIKNCCHTVFFCTQKFHKIVNYFIFEMVKKKIWTNFQRILELFTLKIVIMLSKYGVGIRDPEKTFSGSRIQGLKRHRIPDPDPQHCKIGR